MPKGREKMRKYIIALLVLFLLLVGCIGAAETGRLTFWQGIGLACLCFAAMAAVGHRADKHSRQRQRRHKDVRNTVAQQGVSRSDRLVLRRGLRG